ncbi:hypothetical protein AB0F18_31380 [Streptomyces sp. NPDC029216]|uniref:hypothetical protein n=1 Tax=Streptomyces sp. NPDC029216 TaxID=3154701 RepID=UPI0033D25C35
MSMIIRSHFTQTGAVHLVLTERVPKAVVVQLAAGAVTCALLAGCSSSPGIENYPGNAGLQGPGKGKSTSRVMPREVLEAALPQALNLPRGLDANGARAWDMSNPAICQSEGWSDEDCADALAVGASAASDGKQSIVIRMMSFNDEATAKAHFTGKGTPDEVGNNPPGDEIDGYELPERDRGRKGNGINVRQGTVIAKVEYARSPEHDVPNRLMDLTTMVVERLKQSQSGKNPTASLR